MALGHQKTPEMEVSEYFYGFPSLQWRLSRTFIGGHQHAMDCPDSMRNDIHTCETGRYGPL
jgi:hypothetical protein